MPYLGIFRLEFSNNYCHICTRFAKFCEKQLCLNLGLKMPYLGIFGLVFKKTIVIFEISTLEFA